MDDDTSYTLPPKKRWPRRLAWALGALFLVAIMACAGFLIYASDYYHDLDATHQNLVSSKQLEVTSGPNYVAFGGPAAQTGLVFYPGAKVEYTAYAPLMRELSAKGYVCIVVEMPFNLAFFGIDAATGIMDAFPAVTSWWIGGHSLGGSMAAQYAAAHTDALSGLVLLGAYSASDLSQTNLKNLTAYGENDQVINRDKLAAAASDLMPKDAPCFGTPSVIPGGNHAYFGNYGQQSGDGEASITPEQQWSKTAELIDAAMRTPQACGS